MKNNKNDIYYIIDNIKNIENQIETFKKKKPFFFNRQKLKKYNDRIIKLENIKKSQYKRLEQKIDSQIL